MAVWGLATPLNGAPDERAHVIKSAAEVRGQWIGTQYAGHPPYTFVYVPEAYVGSGLRPCFIHKPNHTANCPEPAVTHRTVRTDTYVGHYPPLYYLLVGAPTMLRTVWSWYLVRSFSAAANAAFLAAGVATALRWGRSRRLLAGIFVAATPMTMLMASVVNPNGLEISAAITMWTAAVVWLCDHPRRPPPGLILVLGVSCAVLVSMRGISPLWLACHGAALLPLAWRRIDLRHFLGQRANRLAVGLTAAALAVTVLWVVAFHALAILTNPPPPATDTWATILRIDLAQMPRLFKQMVGVFGYLDAPLPGLAELLWICALGGVVLEGLARATRRQTASLGLAAAFVVIVPVALTLLTIRKDGFALQGRYLVPLLAGVPVLAGALGGDEPPSPVVNRSARATVWMIAIAQALSGIWTLRRFAVGANGPILPTTRTVGQWQPPLGAVALDLLFLAGWATAALVASRAWSTPASAAGSRPAQTSGEVTSGTQSSIAPATSASAERSP